MQDKNMLCHKCQKGYQVKIRDSYPEQMKLLLAHLFSAIVIREAFSTAQHFVNKMLLHDTIALNGRYQ